MSHTRFCSWRPSLRLEQALLIGALALVVLTLYLEHWGLRCLLLAAYLAALYTCYRGSLLLLTRRLVLLLLVLLLSILPIALERGDASSLYWDWGGWGIGYAGLRQALSTGLRSFSSALILLALLQLLPLYRLYSVLRSLGVPQLFIELVELTYRYIFVLEETTTQIRRAQLSRLGYQGGLSAQIADSTLLLSRTFILSQVEADKLYLGLQSRGYEDEPAAPSAPATTPLVLELRGLGYRYEEAEEALKSLNLEIKRGASIALLGHNGAGKSTLFLLLSGLLEGWSGELLLEGQVVPSKERSLLRRRIALVLQNSNYQLFTPSVEDELRYGLRKLGLAEAALEQRLEELLERYELRPLRHRAPHELSEGQRKWLALVAVLSTDPEVILLDEPTAALDAVYTRRVLGLLEELRAAGKTLIVSTHDMELAYQLAEEVILLERGELRTHRAAAAFWQDEPLLEQVGLAQPWAFRAAQSAPRPAPFVAERERKDSDYSLPVFLHAPSYPILVVGGGKGAWRKAQSLLERHIPLRILAPSLCPELAEAVAAGLCSWEEGHYRGIEDLRGAQLVLLALGDRAREAELARELEAAGRLYACLSDPLLGSVQLGATLQREGLTLSLRSDYRLPELTQALKAHWGAQLPEGLATELLELSQLRRAAHRLEEGEAAAQAREAYEARKEKLFAQLRLR
ncbi:ATP-binding cassette domain-containing protein [Porphyromonas sp.]